MLLSSTNGIVRSLFLVSSLLILNPHEVLRWRCQSVGSRVRQTGWLLFCAPTCPHLSMPASIPHPSITTHTVTTCHSIFCQQMATTAWVTILCVWVRGWTQTLKTLPANLNVFLVRFVTFMFFSLICINNRSNVRVMLRAAKLTPANPHLSTWKDFGRMSSEWISGVSFLSPVLAYNSATVTPAELQPAQSDWRSTPGANFLGNTIIRLFSTANGLNNTSLVSDRSRVCFHRKYPLGHLLVQCFGKEMGLSD